MPELPEVETIARTLCPQVLHRRIGGIAVLRPGTIQHGNPDDVPGARIERIFRRAKLLLMELSLPGGAQRVLAFHLKMTGSFFVHPPGTAPLKHTRLVFDLEPPLPHESAHHFEAGRLFFDDVRTFGYCRIMSPEELEDWPFWRSLGPEPLETPDRELARRFSGRKAAIKAVLLDQSVVAGIGNIYADESLFRAGVAPLARASDISLKRLEHLARQVKSVLLQSIEECGSSIRDYRDARGNAGAFQNSFAVYGRKGENCLRCGNPLESARVAGRATVFCPLCQG